MSKKIPMPPLNSPSDLQDQLIRDITSSVRTRSMLEPNEIDYVLGSNGLDQADIFLGFSFDVYKFYQNIDNTTLPGAVVMFYPPPNIASAASVITLISNSTQLLHIAVSIIVMNILYRLLHIAARIIVMNM